MVERFAVQTSFRKWLIQRQIGEKMCQLHTPYCKPQHCSFPFLFFNFNVFYSCVVFGWHTNCFNRHLQMFKWLQRIISHCFNKWSINKSHRYLLSHLASLTFGVTSQLGSYSNFIRDNFIIPQVQEHLINKTKSLHTWTENPQCNPCKVKVYLKVMRFFAVVSHFGAF